MARLVAAGADKNDIYNRVFNCYSVDRMRLVGYAMDHMKVLDIEGSDTKVALITLSRHTLARFNFKSGDAEGIVNMPMAATAMNYSCLMREDKDKIKISMRSRGDRPVNGFCHDVFNGGGHLNASGGEFYGTLTEAKEAFLSHYKQYFRG